MEIKQLRDAIEQAKQFLELAEPILQDAIASQVFPTDKHTLNSSLVPSGKPTARIRRSSMALSEALVELRKS